MSRSELIVIILSFKKKVAFQDDLVRNLNNISLIQRAIYKAIKVVDDKFNVHVFTDSEEIRLIAERNNIQCYLNADLELDKNSLFYAIKNYLNKYKYKYALFISPYAPLLSTELIENAKNEFYKSDKDILKPIKLIKQDLYDRNTKTSSDILFGSEHKLHRLESKSFTLVRTCIFQKNIEYNPSIIMFPVMHDLLEIESYQDWWVCEKLLNKKRIIFRVIGTRQSGMGHIYRCLTIAHEVVADHEVIFVSDTENIVAIKTLANYDYQLKIFESDKVVENIVKLSPDLVINDILSTKKKDIIPLKKNGIKVVSFEDLGVGAKYTDLTINELYDKPQMKGGNILWGYHYFFVRDEFYNAKSHRFRKSVTSILLTFGGTDQSNLMGAIYPAIRKLCIARNIKIHMVTGSGYINYDKLKNEIEKNKDDEGLVTLTNATGVISKIMEESQIAITSNGRTLYELAHMNMPAIVVSHHERESTHDFACKENGFISTGVFKKKYSEELIVRQLIKLLDNKEYRRKLFDRTIKYCFSTNKRKVIKKITSLLPSEEKGGQH